MYLSLNFLGASVEGNNSMIHSVYKIEANQLFREASGCCPIKISVCDEQTCRQSFYIVLTVNKISFIKLVLSIQVDTII